jgi:hypothetical protein
MLKVTSKNTRKLGDKEVECNMTKINGKYYYDYPYNRELAKEITPEDKKIIAEAYGYTREYIDQIFAGKKWNELVLLTAEKIIEVNNEAKQYKKQIIVK